MAETLHHAPNGGRGSSYRFYDDPDRLRASVARQHGWPRVCPTGPTHRAYREGRMDDVRWRIDLYPLTKPRFVYSDHAGLPIGTGEDGYNLAKSIAYAIRTKWESGASYEEAASPYLPQRHKRHKLGPLYREWLELKEREAAAGKLSLRTSEQYRLYQQHLARWENTAAYDLTIGALKEWDLELTEKGLGPKTRRNLLGALRSMLGWALEAGRIRQVPRFPTIHVPSQPKKHLTPEAQAAVLGKIPEAERGVFLAMATLGLRPGEVRALDLGDYRPGDPPRLVVSKAVQGKSWKGGRIGPTKAHTSDALPVPHELEDWIERHWPLAERMKSDPGAPLFTNPRARHGSSRWSHDALAAAWRRAEKAAKLAHVPLYPSTRHTFAHRVLRETGSMKLTSSLLRHSSVRTTEQHYADVLDEAKVEALRGPKR